MLPEPMDHLHRPGHQAVHQLRIKKVPVGDAVLHKEPVLTGIVQKLSQHFFQLYGPFHRSRLLVFVQSQHIQKLICGIDPVHFRDQPRIQPIPHKFLNPVIYHLYKASHLIDQRDSFL